MPYLVRPYSIEEFRQLLVSHSDASAQVVENKLKSRYFEDYFATLRVQTIVVEKDYIDHDFLEDFAAYYVKFSSMLQTRRLVASSPSSFRDGKRACLTQ